MTKSGERLPIPLIDPKIVVTTLYGLAYPYQYLKYFVSETIMTAPDFESIGSQLKSSGKCERKRIPIIQTEIVDLKTKLNILTELRDEIESATQTNDCQPFYTHVLPLFEPMLMNEIQIAYTDDSLEHV